VFNSVLFLISNFRLILNVASFLLGDSSGRLNFMCRRFEKHCQFHLHRRCRQDWISTISSSNRK